MRVCSVKLISDHSLAAGRGIESLLILSAADPTLMARMIPNIRKEGEMPFNEIPSERGAKYEGKFGSYHCKKLYSLMASPNLVYRAPLVHTQ